MHQRVLFYFLILIGLTVNAETINLHGKVLNIAGQPVPNAIVSLVGQGLKDTTGSDGAYAFSQNTAVEMPFLPSQTEQISLNKGVLEFTLPHNSAVKVEIFNVKGSLLKREVTKNVPAGIYRSNVVKNCGVSNLLVIRASIGSREMTFTYNPFKNDNFTVNSTIENSSVVGTKLAKIEAVNDTLKTTATGYTTKAMAINSYDQQLDITLDTAVGNHSSGYGHTPTLTSGSHTIQTGGQSRSYIIRIPDNYDKFHSYRLIFAFHWRGGNMNDVDGGGTSGYTWSYYGLREQANNSTIFVAPNGIGGGWANSNGQDTKFVDDMLALIKSDLCIDTTRIFAMGFSWGGGMSYALACSRAPVFRAVAVYSGMQLSGCDGGTLPVAYIGLHGVRDGTNNISAGRELRDKFVKNNGCTPQNPPEPSSGSGKHICTNYVNCSTGHPVEWCAFDGDHTPGNVDGGGDDGAKTWTKAEVWKFFTQF